MADTGANLPTLPSTVDLGGAPQIEGDPLEFMQKIARETIDSVNKNAIVNDAGRIEFKKMVLKKLKSNIDLFTEIDQKYAAQKEEKVKAEGEEGAAEEDPFADIFGDSAAAETDESTKEKMEIAGTFASEVKLYKEKFLRNARINKEQKQLQNDEKKMEQILGQLDNM